MGTRIYEIELRNAAHPDGERIVEMMEMGTGDVFNADKTLPRNPGQMETKVEYLRYCLVKDGQEDLTYQTLQGPAAWDARFTMRETLRLCFVWNSIHEPSSGEVDDAQGKDWRPKSGR